MHILNENSRERQRAEWDEVTEDEMVGQHHQLNGHEFEQTSGEGEGQRSLACFSPWGHKESEMSNDNHKRTKEPTKHEWLTGTMLSKRSQTPKRTYCVVPFVCSSRTVNSYLWWATAVILLGVKRSDCCGWGAEDGIIWKVITQVKTVTRLYEYLQPHTSTVLHTYIKYFN